MLSCACSSGGSDQATQCPNLGCVEMSALVDVDRRHIYAVWRGTGIMQEIVGCSVKLWMVERMVVLLFISSLFVNGLAAERSGQMGNRV